MTDTTTTGTVPVLKAVATVEPTTTKAKAAKAAEPDPFVQSVLDQINEAVEDPNVQVTVSRVTKYIPAKARNIIYIVGIVVGSLTTAAGPIVALLTGDAAIVGASALGIALTLTNVLSKLNLSKTADDIAKETATNVA